MVEFYFLCVDFMTELANLTNSSYRDTNMIVLFGFLPMIIIIDVIIFLFLLTRKIIINKKSKKKGT